MNWVFVPTLRPNFWLPDDRIKRSPATILKLQSIQNLLRESGFRIPIHVLGNILEEDPLAHTEMLRDLCSLQPRAIVYDAIALIDAARLELQRFMKTGGHVVCYDMAVELECDQVVFDREHNTHLAMSHLLALGHRQIGFYLGPMNSPYNARRVIGLKRALGEWQAPFLEDWQEFSFVPPEERPGIYLARRFLAKKQRPTAMCIVNDQTAVEFMVYVQRHGLRVPEDVSIVSHDDLPLASSSALVQLTSVSLPAEEIARHVARFIMERVSGQYKGSPRRVEVRGELTVRESTARL